MIWFVAPLVGAWIEIFGEAIKYVKRGVAPLVGAWIEIQLMPSHTLLIKSLPLWERGLKSLVRPMKVVHFLVAPLVGAWIEIEISLSDYLKYWVAPLVGAWIEMNVRSIQRTREGYVAPLVGAWIEIYLLQLLYNHLHRRSPCGSVD